MLWGPPFAKQSTEQERKAVFNSPTGTTVWVNPRDYLSGAAHEEQRNTQHCGEGEQCHRETWNDSKRQAPALHDYTPQQHPDGCRGQIYGTWTKQHTHRKG